jgi:DNA polymerase-1
MKKTKSGKWSVDQEVLSSIEPRPKSIEFLLEYGKLYKLYSTYIIGIEKKVNDDNRLRSSFNLQTTVTGRLSSSEPNLQNISRDPKIKNIFKAPKNRLLIEADYSQLELRLLAHFSDDDFLLDVFSRGGDLHSEMAREIYGLNFTDNDRTKVKSLNFGIIYGITAYSIAQQLKIPMYEAQRMIDKWFERAPKAKQYLEDCEKQLMEGKIFVTPMGRERRYGIITDDQGLKNESRNFKIQSTGSDLNLLSAIKLEDPLLKLNAFSVNLIHDAILVECNNLANEVPKVVNLMRKIMESVPIEWLHPKIPFIVGIKYGFKWGEMVKE